MCVFQKQYPSLFLLKMADDNHLLIILSNILSQHFLMRNNALLLTIVFIFQKF